MEPGALLPYERALITGEPLALFRHDSHFTMLLDVDRWRRPADKTDLMILEHAVGPALDIGCGPGRITAALNRRGLFTIGIDISAVAVAMARARGVTVLRGDVFRPLPGEGRWKSVLLLDGNIGIGGQPEALLRRAHQLLAPHGLALIETHPDPIVDERRTVRFAHNGAPIGNAFPWALVGSDVLRRLAEGLFNAEDAWTRDGRSFTVLRRLR